METIEVLYIILGACVVVITVTIVWLANETMRLVRSLRKSSEDVEFMTSEFKEKVLMVSEALDRAGSAATNIISLVEDAIEGIKEKRDQLSDSIGLVTGVGEYFKKRKEKSDEKKEEPIEEKPKKVVKKINEPVQEKVKKEEPEEEIKEEETKKADDLEDAKPIKKEVAEKK